MNYNPYGSRNPYEELFRHHHHNAHRGGKTRGQAGQMQMMVENYFRHGQSCAVHIVNGERSSTVTHHLDGNGLAFVTEKTYRAGQTFEVHYPDGVEVHVQVHD